MRGRGDSVDRVSERGSFQRLLLQEAARAVRTGLRKGIRARSRSPAPSRLILAPQELRTADPTVAADIYAGYFVFAGRSVATGGRSPFDVAPPSRAWAETLYGFGWLRHLRAAGTALAQANARALVDEFVSQRRGERGIARETHILARRITAFVSQSPLLLEGADHGFYHRFLRAIGRSVRDLEEDARRHPLPRSRLAAAIALCYAGLCSQGLEGPLRRGTRLLVRELARQILPDGGHASRDPGALIELLLDLLPLRQMYASRGADVPEALLNAIDRMLPMIRMFRHGDGTLSHFNGMGVTAADRLATLLIYDDLMSQPIHQATHSAYERIEAGDTLMVADVGAPPPVALSGRAGAGCLSFELSSGAQRIVVNCGLPRHPGEAMVEASRQTAAHSTAAIGGVSSAQVLDPGDYRLARAPASWLLRRLGPVLVAGPQNVSAERREEDGAQVLRARHDGYVGRFGIVHERRWRLSEDGQVLDGEDRFRPKGGSEAAEAAIRFHLAPGIRASVTQAGRVVMLLLPNRDVWQFEVGPAEARLEDSVFFAATDGPRRTAQIVVTVDAVAVPEVRWRFARLTRAAEPA